MTEDEERKRQRKDSEEKHRTKERGAKMTEGVLHHFLAQRASAIFNLPFHLTCSAFTSTDSILCSLHSLLISSSARLHPSPLAQVALAVPHSFHPLFPTLRTYFSSCLCGSLPGRILTSFPPRESFLPFSFFFPL